jgi:hypothetical protein
MLSVRIESPKMARAGEAAGEKIVVGTAPARSNIPPYSFG